MDIIFQLACQAHLTIITWLLKIPRISNHLYAMIFLIVNMFIICARCNDRDRRKCRCHSILSNTPSYHPEHWYYLRQCLPIFPSDYINFIFSSYSFHRLRENWTKLCTIRTNLCKKAFELWTCSCDLRYPSVWKFNSVFGFGSNSFQILILCWMLNNKPQQKYDFIS